MQITLYIHTLQTFQNWNLKKFHSLITCQCFGSSPLFFFSHQMSIFQSVWAEPVGPLFWSTVKDHTKVLRVKSLLRRSRKSCQIKRSSHGGPPPSTAETGAAARESGSGFRQNSWFKPSACLTAKSLRRRQQSRRDIAPPRRILRYEVNADGPTLWWRRNHLAVRRP